MGISLYFSNQLMPLADRLDINLASEPRDDNGLQPPVVIVPNMNLSKWLKLTLATKSGIFMNVDFQYLETGLWQMIRPLVGPSDVEPELLEQDGLKVMLFFILMTSAPNVPDLSLVKHYLIRSGRETGPDVEIRCWQLSEELARLFQEYEYNRSDMIQSWLADEPPEDAMEACQKWMYREMMRLKEQLGRSLGRPLVSMVEYARKLPGSFASDLAKRFPVAERVHIFGLSQISPFHLQLLSRLQYYFDIHIYSLNPSREYWEDIQTPYEKKWIRRQRASKLALRQDEVDAGDLFTQADHPLLSAWGKPGRESVRLLCQLTDYTFQAGFTDPPQPDNVLDAVSHGLLTLETLGDTPLSLDQDRTLQVMACPGIRREVETVYNSILYNLETDAQLCMTDIAVMVTDMARYKPVVDSVFSRQPARITYNLVDSNARTESVFAQAVLAVMALSRGSFSRKQVFDLLRNPCVMQRWGYGPDALSVWIGWANELGIFHGYENPNDRDADSPPAGRFSWRQGLERLRLSRIMTSAMDMEHAARFHFKGNVPFADMHTGNERLLESFCRLIMSLDAAIATLRMASASALAWRNAFYRVLDQFVEIPGDLRGEETVYQSLVAAFDHFVRYDEMARENPARPLTADALLAFISSHLEGVTGGQGDYLTGGVTVSALMPMRPIPFKVVYVLGLEEGRFPGRVPESQLDLRNRKRRIGDITPTERNRYLFLEILISVGHKLYLSYVSRDLQKDRDMAPCSVLLQLKRYLEQHIIGGRSFQISHIPIKADSLATMAPDATNKWSDVMVDSNLANMLSRIRRGGLWPAFTEQASSAELETAACFNPDLTCPGRSTEKQTDQIVPLTTRLLRQFLLDPVEVVGRYHLGIAPALEPTIEQAELEHEPLASQFPADYRIRTMPIRNWLVSLLSDSCEQPYTTSLGTEFETVYADLSRKSLVPGGAFAAHDRSRLKQQVMATGKILYPIVEQMRMARQLYSAIVFGTAMDDFSVASGEPLLFDPVLLEVPCAKTHAPRVTVELNGWLPWVWQSTQGSWHCLVLTGSNRKSPGVDKFILEPLLTIMGLFASEQSPLWSDANHLTVHVVYGEHVKCLDYHLDHRLSTDYMSQLAGELLTPSPLLWLPFERLFENKNLRAYILKSSIDDGDRKAFFESLSRVMHASVDIKAELIEATLTADILDHARRRFSVFAPSNRNDR